MVTTGAVLSLIFTIPQIITWRRNHLHPLGVLLMSVFVTAFWLSEFIMGILFAALFDLDYNNDERGKLEQGATILSIFTA